MKAECDDRILSTIVTPEYPIDPLELLGERSFNEPREIPKAEIGSPVQEFFRDTTIFLTGATGFIGCVLLEKLLRSCPHIERIYLLVREKRGKSTTERLEDIFKDKLFKRLKYEIPTFMTKLSVIEGDMERVGLGISSEGRNRLLDEVNIIYHCAANVRFDEKLANAVKNKFFSTRELIKMARDCKKLKALMYVSTAYSFCTSPVIKENIPPMPVHYSVILQMVESKKGSEMDLEESQLLGDWPNSYAFTKAMTECMLKEEAQDLPLCIFRPSIVMETYREPIKGWINNQNGPVAVFLGGYTGVLHIFPGSSEDKFLNTVPVDSTVNALICATKETAEEFATTERNEIPVYNYANVDDNIPSWKQIVELDDPLTERWPYVGALWIHSATLVKNKILFAVLSFLLHTIPGYILDWLLVINGRKPRLTKMYQKFNSSLPKLDYFIRNRWKFENTRINNLWNRLPLQDRDIFFFNVAEISWQSCCETRLLGLRVYLLKDDIRTLPVARQKYKRLYRAHIILKYGCYAFLLFLIWTLLKQLMMLM